MEPYHDVIQAISGLKPTAVRNECNFILDCPQENYIQQSRPDLLTAMFAKAVIARVGLIKSAFCGGCIFTNELGFKGHPSQRNHECLYLGEIETLNIGFVLAFMTVDRKRVAIEFLNSL